MDTTTPSDLQVKAHSLCSEFLGGKWKEVTADQLQITPLKGGLTNELFICALPYKVPLYQVVLRFYGKATCDIPLQIEIVSLLAEKNLGPKMYGYFDEGRLEEYLPSSPLTSGQMRDPSISAMIAKKIASIQHLNVPIPKNKCWLLNMYEECYSHFKNITKPDVLLKQENIPNSTKDAIVKLLSINFENEIEFLKQIFDKSSSPLVFTNNDLHQNNILLIDKSESKPNLEDRIVLIDFEYASYNFRSFEVANHFAEWRFDYHVPEYPFFLAREEMFPSVSEQRNFIKPYLLQSKLLDHLKKVTSTTSSACSNGTDLTVEEAEIEEFLDEVFVFVMASDLLWAIWAVKSALASETKHFFWELAMAKWSFYENFKREFNKNKYSVASNGKSRL